MTKHIKVNILSLMDEYQTKTRWNKRLMLMYYIGFILWVILALIPGQNIPTMVVAISSLCVYGVSMYFRRRIEILSDEIVTLAQEEGFIEIKTDVITTVQSDNQWFKRIFGDSTMDELKLKFPNLTSIELEYVEVTFPKFHEQYQHIINQIGFTINDVIVTMYDHDTVIDQFHIKI